MSTALKTKLEWPKRPRRNWHGILGPMQRWTSRCGRFRVERFLAYTRVYIAIYAEPLSGHVWHKISDHRTLTAAERACQQFARQKELTG